MAGKGRQNADDRLIVELAGGKTVAEAAAVAGIGERTVYRRLNDPAFRKCLSDARSAFVEQALAKLAGASGRAVATLVTLLDAEADSIKLGAARSILDAGLKLREAVELEDRIRRLEQANEGDPNDHDRATTGAA
ncbi:MAG: hypothetical protein IT428_32640 [Planctomycetaceae bacterium]|nr:hypothetical protein [Planctomycetaceae bacterium]